MDPIAPGLSCLDLRFLGCANAIATVVVVGRGGVALLDPGPNTCLESLERGLQGAGIQLSDVTDILITHIHLDHAGATGTIVARQPHVRVHVHDRGAAHLSDPTRLLESARRLYGDDMDRLWGAVEPVPPRNISLVGEGTRVGAGGRTFEVAYTPGHASHHVSYFDRDSGVAFVGDTAGVCIGGGYVLPPTPPPDIDLELWTDSVERIERWRPQALFLTHFGPVRTVAPHLQSLLDNLIWAAEQVRSLLAEPGSDEAHRQGFAERFDRRLRQFVDGKQLAAYQLAAPPALLWIGLERYWRKKVG